MLRLSLWQVGLEGSTRGTFIFGFGSSVSGLSFLRVGLIGRFLGLILFFLRGQASLELAGWLTSELVGPYFWSSVMV